MRAGRFRRCSLFLMGAAAVSLVACKANEGSAASPSGAADNQTSAGAASTVAADVAAAKQGNAATSSAGDVEVEEETDAYNFAYSYPAAAKRLPALKARLDGEVKSSKAELVQWATEGETEAKKDGRPFMTYDGSTGWSVVTDLPEWLSLSAETYSFTGGAHGNTGYKSLLWNKKTDSEQALAGMFSSAAALEKAVRPAMCDALDAERSKRRQAKVVRDQSDWMNACPELKDATIILGSRSRKAFDRIGFIFAPYAAGPYVEGAFEVTLPVTPAVMAAVKPEFRSSFAAGR